MLQEPSTGPYPEADESSPCYLILSLLDQRYAIT
jgi:hypothetical protein